MPSVEPPREERDRRCLVEARDGERLAGQAQRAEAVVRILLRVLAAALPELDPGAQQLAARAVAARQARILRGLSAQRRAAQDERLDLLLAVPAGPPGEDAAQRDGELLAEAGPDVAA
ncbi:MAG TPA: hypothetical protein VL977_02630, partial [Solirubrobacteraceae bacterium]|nr:hypothetical protein [Solirubrobacteraceae bacterium]